MVKGGSAAKSLVVSCRVAFRTRRPVEPPCGVRGRWSRPAVYGGGLCPLAPPANANLPGLWIIVTGGHMVANQTRPFSFLCLTKGGENALDSLLQKLYF